MIKVENVSKTYNGKKILNNISFEVKAGETLAVVGVSGAGKSTVLKIISGLVEPDEGKVILDGDNVAMIFQYSALFDSLNISDNISSSGKSDNDDESSNTSSGDACSRTSNNSNNFILDIAVLNEISKACHIAMNNISYLSNRICDREMKKELVAIYSQYAHILLQVDQHFEKYGEIPASIPNSLKIMGQTGIRLNIKFDRSPSHIAEIMIQGENMGIIKCQKLLNMNYDVQESTTTLLKTFKDFQKENISTLSRYL